VVTVMNDLPVNVIRVVGDSAGVIAIWKPAGLATQAPPGIPSAESWLRRELHGESSRGYLGVPHRIDRGVSGVVLFAATPRAARKLSRQFERRQVRKSYLAIVTCGEASRDTVAALVQAGDTANGAAAPASAGAVTWCDWLEKIPEEARARLVAAGEPGGREAVTLARLRCRLSPDRLLPDRLLLELSPVTGRMHQLRLQAAARGLPILGDDLYGVADDSWAGPLQPREGDGLPDADPRMRPIALHASRITYADPDTGSEVTIEAALPAYWPEAARCT
jgi:23S rRNA pseudouridine1911/1915/1917 synthase